MLNIGQFFNKNGYEYCLIEKIKLGNTKYYLFSMEKDKKIGYKFYTLNSYSEEEGYDFEPVKDMEIKAQLYNILEERLKDDVFEPVDEIDENTSVD